MLAANLRLRDDQLQGVCVVGLVDGVVQDADGFQVVTNHPHLVLEVRGVGNDLLALGLELHALSLFSSLLHRCPNTGDLATLVLDLVNVGVEHVCATIDGTQASETLRQLTQTVEWVDVRALSIAGHAVDVKTNALDAVPSSSLLVNILVGGVESHAVANEVAGGRLEAVLIVDLLHRGLGQVHA